MGASYVTDLVLDLYEVDGGVLVEDVGVDHESDFRGEALEEGAGGLGGAVCWGDWDGCMGGGLWTADLAGLNQFAEGFGPATTTGVVVEERVGVADEPGVEVTHVLMLTLSLYRCVLCVSVVYGCFG